MGSEMCIRDRCNTESCLQVSPGEKVEFSLNVSQSYDLGGERRIKIRYEVVNFVEGIDEYCEIESDWLSIDIPTSR